MSDFIITAQFAEQLERGNAFDYESQAHDHKKKEEDVMVEPVIITFEEEPYQSPLSSDFQPLAETELMPAQVLEVGDEIGDVTEFTEDDAKEEMKELTEENKTQDHGKRIPGVENYVEDEEETEEEPEEQVEGDWETARNPKAFMAYILRRYPGEIPKHDGKSISACEKVITFLNKLNSEISEALRNDTGDDLDVGALENIRVNMIKDVSLLKDHTKKLQRKHRNSIKRKADELPGLDENFVKEATTPRVQIVANPFERAITGILINSVVSAGHPLEDVYDFLKKKYAFTDREELSIMQLAQDMGFPIFKDRGTIGQKGEVGGEKHGVDFIKNYFA